ncbi:hypothetical protein LINPERPRIM_LOCUS21588 [Linum perenne]
MKASQLLIRTALAVTIAAKLLSEVFSVMKGGSLSMPSVPTLVIVQSRELN